MRRYTILPVSLLINPLVSLGASAKFRCLGKLSHPPLLSRQVKAVLFISKISIIRVVGCVLAEEHIVVPIEN